MLYEDSLGPPPEPTPWATPANGGHPFLVFHKLELRIYEEPFRKAMRIDQDSPRTTSKIYEESFRRTIRGDRV